MLKQNYYGTWSQSLWEVLFTLISGVAIQWAKGLRLLYVAVNLGP